MSNTTKTAIKPFKSDRAAKTAYTRQHKVWSRARDAYNDARHARTPGEPTVEELKQMAAWEAEYTALSGHAKYESQAWESFCALWNEISNRPLKAAEALMDEEFSKLTAIYQRATEQGFFINSYELGDNPTRVLISNNMD